MDILDELNKINRMEFDDAKISLLDINAGFRESVEISKMIKKNIQKTDTIYMKLDEISDAKLEIKKLENQIIEMVKGYVRVFDYLWEIHKYSLENNKELSTDFNNIFEKLESEMKKIGIFIDNPINQKYQTKSHEIISTKQNTDIQNETIVEVFKVGINFNGEIIRKAQVITILN